LTDLCHHHCCIVGCLCIGYEFGLYDAINVVTKHNVIVVTFNYRLGPFGFLGLNQLRAEDPAGKF
jgi:carboxylesterase type B